MKGERLVERFGFNLPKDVSKRKTKITHVEKVDFWHYDSRHKDWLHPEHESTLIGCISTFK